MYFPLKVRKPVKLRESPWSKIQNLSSNKLLLADDSHFAIFDIETRKIQTSFEELRSFQSDIIAVFLTRNTENVLLLLKTSKIIVFNISKQNITRVYNNLTRILKRNLNYETEVKIDHDIKTTALK